jgi:hypothetical protein
LFPTEPFTLNPKGKRPMDIDAMKRDLTRAIETLPVDLVLGVASAIVPHVPALQRHMPGLIPVLMPHITAGMIEASCGALDKDEIGAAIQDVIKTYVENHVPIPYTVKG